LPYVGKMNMPNCTLDEELGISRSNQPILRFADILLIYAEAANMAGSGPTQLAVDRVNMIIDRANTPKGVDIYGVPEVQGIEPRATMAMSQAEFDKKVIDERSYELCFEFDRLFDVLRKRILLEVNLPDNAEGYEETDYLFPIPVFDATFIGNNPGYE
jgi:starch-binding outer membrane protein, SusD/RagB family